MELRPYQTLALQQIKAEYKKGNRRVLLWLATGAGKTVIFSWILKEMSARGKKAAMIVKGRQLVDQASKRLFRESVRHGVRMANHWNKDFSAPIQLCSVDTIVSRGPEFYPDAELIVIDECHLATSESYKKLLSFYGDRFVLGVTATPWTKDGLAHVADVVVHPIGMKELIEQNYLVPARYFAPSVPDLKGVGTSAGDYVNEQIHKRMDALTGDIVETWKKRADGRPTLLFACNINHSMECAEKFNLAGVPAMHMEADHSLDERNKAFEALESGKLKVICNVGTCSTGVDIPKVACLIFARPTKSYSLFIQQAGRGTRIADGKTDFLILDHAGNTLRHGFIDDEPKVDLDSIEKLKMLNVKRCTTCFQVYVGSWCPDCGPKKSDIVSSKEIMQVEGELVELRGLTETILISRRFDELKRTRKQKGYKRNWMFFQLAKEFGADVAQKLVPAKITPPWITGRTQ